MTTRYITMPFMSESVWPKATDFLARTVHEAEPKPIKTGILDANGTPIYRVTEMEPVGFIRRGKC